jgi:hypothetical protein
VLLLLDRSAVDYGDDTHLIPAEAANSEIADVGLRNQLPFFLARKGEAFTLPGGAGGSDGWFALRSVQGAWATEDGAGDGLENFFLAGAGLGSPDENGNRAAFLESVPDVAPLRWTGLGMLAGRQVCAVVYSGEIAPGETTNLSGATLGVVAFNVTGSATAGADLPAITLEVLDARDICSGTLVPFAEAPLE